MPVIIQFHPSTMQLCSTTTTWGGIYSKMSLVLCNSPEPIRLRILLVYPCFHPPFPSSVFSLLNLRLEAPWHKYLHYGMFSGEYQAHRWCCSIYCYFLQFLVEMCVNIMSWAHIRYNYLGHWQAHLSLAPAPLMSNHAILNAQLLKKRGSPKFGEALLRWLSMCLQKLKCQNCRGFNSKVSYLCSIALKKLHYMGARAALELAHGQLSAPDASTQRYPWHGEVLKLSLKCQQSDHSMVAHPTLLLYWVWAIGSHPCFWIIMPILWQLDCKGISRFSGPLDVQSCCFKCSTHMLCPIFSCLARMWTFRALHKVGKGMTFRGSRLAVRVSQRDPDSKASAKMKLIYRLSESFQGKHILIGQDQELSWVLVSRNQTWWLPEPVCGLGPCPVAPLNGWPWGTFEGWKQPWGVDGPQRIRPPAWAGVV